MKKVLLILMFLFTITLAPLPAYAQIDNDLLDNIKKSSDIFNRQASVETQNKAIDNAIGNIIAFVLSFAGVIFLILMIIASFIWITAQGDKQKITSAKKLLTSGVVGAFISFGAFIIVNTFLIPLSERYFTPVNFTSGGSNVSLSQISCSNQIQCADQPTRKICQDNNCVECVQNDESTDGSNWSSACVQIYNYEKPICDTVNYVCMPDPTEVCSNLSLNSCLAREDCRWQYSFQDENFWGALGTLGTNAVGENTLNWLGVNTTNDKIGGACKTQSDYGCEEQCGIEKPFCLKDFTPARCVECRTDDDCASNVWYNKCSTMSGNYVCVPF